MFYPYRIEHDYTCHSLKTKTCIYTLNEVVCIRYEFEELAYLILLAIISLVVFDNYKKEVPSLWSAQHFILRACPLLINLVEVLLAHLWRGIHSDRSIEEQRLITSIPNPQYHFYFSLLNNKTITLEQSSTTLFHLVEVLPIKCIEFMRISSLACQYTWFKHEIKRNRAKPLCL
jgi:hypothetical protein